MLRWRQQKFHRVANWRIPRPFKVGSRYESWEKVGCKHHKVPEQQPKPRPPTASFCLSIMPSTSLPLLKKSCLQRHSPPHRYPVEQFSQAGFPLHTVSPTFLASSLVLTVEATEFGPPWNAYLFLGYTKSFICNARQALKFQLITEDYSQIWEQDWQTSAGTKMTHLNSLQIINTDLLSSGPSKSFANLVLNPNSTLATLLGIFSSNWWQSANGKGDYISQPSLHLWLAACLSSVNRRTCLFLELPWVIYSD